MAAAGGSADGGGVEDLTDTAERRGRFEPEPDADPRAGSPTEGDRRTVQRSNSSSIGASCTGLDHLTAGWGSCASKPDPTNTRCWPAGPVPEDSGHAAWPEGPALHAGGSADRQGRLDARRGPEPADRLADRRRESRALHGGHADATSSRGNPCVLGVGADPPQHPKPRHHPRSGVNVVVPGDVRLPRRLRVCLSSDFDRRLPLRILLTGSARPPSRTDNRTSTASIVDPEPHRAHTLPRVALLLADSGLRSASRHDPSADLAESDPPPCGTRVRWGLMTISSPSSRKVRFALAHRHGFRSAPGKFDECAALVFLRAGDGARGEEVTGAGGGAVHGGVREHLRLGDQYICPYGGRLDDLPVPRDLQVDVEAPRLCLGEVRQRLLVLFGSRGMRAASRSPSAMPAATMPATTPVPSSPWPTAAATPTLPHGSPSTPAKPPKPTCMNRCASSAAVNAPPATASTPPPPPSPDHASSSDNRTPGAGRCRARSARTAGRVRVVAGLGWSETGTPCRFCATLRRLVRPREASEQLDPAHVEPLACLKRLSAGSFEEPDGVGCCAAGARVRHGRREVRGRVRRVESHRSATESDGAHNSRW